MRRHTALLALALLAPLTLAGASAPAQQPSAVGSADPLADRLAAMDAPALVAAFDAEVRGQEPPETALRRWADVLAERATEVAPEHREELLDRSIEARRRLVELGQTAASTDRLAEYFVDLTALAQAVGQLAVEPQINRLALLQAGPADAQAVRDAAEEGLALLVRGLDQAGKLLPRIRVDSQAIVSGLVAQLEQQVRVMEYQAAWQRLNLALALDDRYAGDDEQRRTFQVRRQQLYGETADSSTLAELAEGDAASGVMHWALLLRGLAVAELGELDNARAFLARAAATEAEPAVQFRANFELARLLARQQDLPAAMAQLETTRRMAIERFGDAGRPAVAFQTAFLERDLLRSQDRAAGDPQQAASLEARAQEPLLEFLETYPEFASELTAALAAQVTGEPDASLNAVERFARASTADGPRDSAQAYRAILEANDPLSERIRPLVLWNLAALRYQQDDGALEAAELFGSLAEQYPRRPQAFDAARYAALILGGLVEDGRTDAALRRQYASALTWLLERWGDRPEVAAEFIAPLARQCEALGETDQAIEWFQRVPPTSPDYSRARHEALMLRAAQLASASDAAAREAAAEVLVRDLTQYAAEAHARAAAATDPAVRQSEAALGADADLRAAAVLKNEMNRLRAALDQLDVTVARWGDDPAVRAAAQGLRVQVHVDAGDIAQAIEVMRQLDGGAELAGQVAQAIRQRIETLRDQPQRQPELEQWQRNYLEFARRIASDDAPYAYRQMLAEALVGTGQPQEGLPRFELLAREEPDDAGNVWGIARAHRQLAAAVTDPAQRQSHHAAAVQAYMRLISGLAPERFPAEQWRGETARAWWRAQLELAQTLVEAFAEQPAQMRAMGIRIDQLRRQDPNFGGLLPQFNAVASDAAARSGG